MEKLMRRSTPGNSGEGEDGSGAAALPGPASEPKDFYVIFVTNTNVQVIILY